jgi:hypothetical protein
MIGPAILLLSISVVVYPEFIEGHSSGSGSALEHFRIFFLYSPPFYPQENIAT